MTKMINLLPESEVKELKLELASKQFLKFFSMIFITLLLFILASVVGKIWVSAEMSGDDSVISSLQSQLNSSDNQALQKEIVQLNGQIKNVKSFQQQHYAWSKVLTEIGNLSPSDFQLQLLTADKSNGQIVINGTAGKRDSVLQFWSNVKKSSYFQNINFPLTNLEQPTNTPFTFTFFINPAQIKNQP